MPCEVQWLVNWTATGNAVMFWGAWTGCMSQASDYFKNNTVYHDINPEKRLCIKKNTQYTSATCGKRGSQHCSAGMVESLKKVFPDIF